jgi:flagellar hook assembly protein FlgD
MAVGNVSDRNYLDLIGSANSDTPKAENLAKKYGIEYTTGEEGNLGFEDFLTLMITQLTNQDFTNPVDDTQFMTQMTQYSTLQAMQEMASYSQSNYAMSMIGKTVTASKYSNGNMVKETGTVSEIHKNDDGYEIMINGKSFSMKQIMSIGNGETEDDKTEVTASAPETAYTAANTTGVNQTQADTQQAPNYQIEEDLLAAAAAAMG